MVSPTSAQAATFAVTNTSDSGAGSLRQAILDANANVGADTIDFAVTGAIVLTGGQLTVTDDLTVQGPGAASLTISGNNSTRVLQVSAGVTLDVRDVTIANGRFVAAPQLAGAGILSAGSLIVTGVTFSANDAGGSCCSGLPGGAIANDGGTVTVSDSVFSGNLAGGEGGGIYSTGGSVSVSDSVFSGNSTNNWGGGIFISGGTLSVTDTTFDANSDVFSGGGIGTIGGSVTVTNSTFSDNVTSFAGGGGIWNQGGTLTVTNSTFSGNTATFAGFSTGGGISNEGGGTATITHATFSDNAAGAGGAIYNEAGASLTLQNTIVANSPAGGNCVGAITDGGGNLQHPGADCGSTITSTDPLLGPLQNNGGPTQTHALPGSSPALDTATTLNCPATDQRGISRPQGPNCDIGAFELVDADGPLTIEVVLAPNPVAIGASTTLTATVDDSTTGGSTISSAEYSLDGGATWNPTAAVDSSFDEVEEAVTATFFAPATPSIYDLCVRGTDSAGAVGPGSCIQLVVYDPSGGFVTGGGWIDSPAGAYPADPSAAGRATFAFVSKYKKGATVPSGTAQFVFQAAALEFRSTAYQWLVVNQAGTNAQFKGTGTINGLGTYDFMVWATEATASTPATFRIRITDGSGAVYDNGSAQPIAGGAIIVHKEK